MKIIVTGASKGIGQGIASFLAMDGHEVGLIARSPELLGDICQSIADQGGTAFAAACDIRNPDNTNHAVGHLIATLGGCDALINNAGLVIRKNIFDLSLDEWNQLIDTNVTGMFHVTRAILPHFRAQQRGHIINISSISGKVPLPGGSAYAASKFAVTGFSQSLLLEVREHGIKVTTVFPGSVDSQSHRHPANADHSWKVTPAQIGQACADILRTDNNTLISELEIRPLNPAPKES